MKRFTQWSAATTVKTSNGFCSAANDDMERSNWMSPTVVVLDKPIVCRKPVNEMRVLTAFITGLLPALGGCHKDIAIQKMDPTTAVEVLVPEQGAYTGAFIDFGEAEEDVTLETIE